MALFTLIFALFFAILADISEAVSLLSSALSPFFTLFFLCSRTDVAGEGGEFFLTGGVKIRIFPAQDGLRSNSSSDWRGGGYIDDSVGCGGKVCA